MNYILLKKSQAKEPTDTELDEIHERAIQYRQKFETSGIKGGGTKEAGRRQQIRGIIRQVERLASDQQTFVLNQLGVRPIWYQEYDEIPELVNRILSN